jgi:RsiW-degrading membrane proteinase PrsW (M82 family)
MRMDLLAPTAFALLPVLAFLLMLLGLDSYKLVRLRLVVAVIAAGALAALLGNPLTDWLAVQPDISFSMLTRYVAPPIEELLKAAVIVALLRTNRVGFLIDAAICGFAVGTGFATVENIVYLHNFAGAPLGVWLLRGFGTAIMHGGASTLFALVTLALLERHGRLSLRVLLPGYLLAVLLHSGFNHFFLSPLASTVGILLVLPPLLHYVFRRSERAVGDWLGKSFDADADMLELIDSDRFDESPVGRYLRSLTDKLDGPVVADVFCYLRLHSELALRAKGRLMLRESGFEPPPPDADTRAKLAELDYLRKSIGRTMLIALHQHLRMSHKELWQITMTT